MKNDLFFTNHYMFTKFDEFTFGHCKELYFVSRLDEVKNLKAGLKFFKGRVQGGELSIRSLLGRRRQDKDLLTIARGGEKNENEGYPGGAEWRGDRLTHFWKRNPGV